MHPWWAYDEVKRRQDQAERAAERRAALRSGDEVEAAGRGRRIRLRRSRDAQSLALRLPGGALFLIPRSAARDWKAA